MSTTLVFKQGTGTSNLASGEPGWNTSTQKLYVGTGSGNILIGPGGSGTVTSVAAAGPTGILTWSSAITTSGTLTATLVTQSAHTALLGPTSGGAATPAFRLLVAADIPDLSAVYDLAGAAAAAQAASQPLDAGLTALAGGSDFVTFSGPTTSTKTFALPNASSTILTTNAVVTVTQGGIGVGTLLSHGILLGQGTSAVVATAVMTDGQLLVGQSAADPLPKTVSGSGATITLSAAGLLTISAITNAALANSSVTVSPGSGLSGGGTVALGSSISLSLASIIPQAETIQVTDASSSSSPTILTLEHSSSSPGASNFGSIVSWLLNAAGVPSVQAVSLNVDWSNVAGPVYQGEFWFNAYGSGGAGEVLRGGVSVAAAPTIGFLGASPSPALASPDLGTLAVTFGLATGTPTFSATHLTGMSAASLLLGRGSAAGAGVVQEIILGSGLTMAGTTLSATATGSATLDPFLLMGA